MGLSAKVGPGSVPASCMPTWLLAPARMQHKPLPDAEKVLVPDAWVSQNHSQTDCCSLPITHSVVFTYSSGTQRREWTA